MKKLIAAVAVLVPLAACGDGDMHEISRHPAPDGSRDVVVGTMKAGETEPFLVVMTAKPGDNINKGARLFLADKGDAPQVEWQSTDQLTISCKDARVWSYRSFWTNPNNGKTIAVGLKCGTEGWKG
ncbi:MAG: hypothetical protein HYU59_05950 [Magnetospirillum gryphiswaldense]|nr:hypothetical protein [Magnetospirillum gryphiswaldense]